MSLPEDFQFSQSSLQDFVDCRRRFQLRYQERLAWPAIETEPVSQHEHFLNQGARFHQMAQQHLLGVPFERLRLMIHDADLARWWENYHTFWRQSPALEDLELSDARRIPEISLSAPLAGSRLVAKYDLILMTSDGQALIIDWKTSQKRPKRSQLEERLQTRVYPYLLVRAGTHLNQGAALQPESVEMIYWFVNFPENPARFRYSQDKYHKDATYLQDVITTIQQLPDNQFPLTSDERRCTFCIYRSLCNRGVRAGSIEDIASEMEPDEPPEISLDFEQIVEIEF